MFAAGFGLLHHRFHAAREAGGGGGELRVRGDQGFGEGRVQITDNVQEFEEGVVVDGGDADGSLRIVAGFHGEVGILQGEADDFAQGFARFGLGENFEMEAEDRDEGGGTGGSPRLGGGVGHGGTPGAEGTAEQGCAAFAIVRFLNQGGGGSERE